MLIKDGVTLVEILVVVVLAVLVMGSGILIWTRTGRTVVKGEEMMDLQLALRSINESIRSDVRTLVGVKSCSNTKMAFTALKKGKEVEIIYEFEGETRTLRRRATDSPVSDLHASGLVARVEFSAMPSAGPFEYLRMALELRSREKKGNPSTSLATVSQFSSHSLEPPFEVVR